MHREFYLTIQLEGYWRERYRGVDVDGHDHTGLTVLGLGAVEPQWAGVVDGDGE